MTTLTKGTRVMTPRGLGLVAYVRMDQDDLSKVFAVSVVLDARRNVPGYAGTIFPAAVVTVAPEEV